ncbi:putative Ig domain-containing protein, partial [Thermodesulfobacteriota bacterium]
VGTSFTEATTLTETFTLSSAADSTNSIYGDSSLQHPLLEDNGDGTGSNSISGQAWDDGALCTALDIGVSGATANAADVNVIGVSQAQHLTDSENTAILQACVDSRYFTRLWVEVKGPEYTSGSTPGQTEQIAMDLPQTVLDGEVSGGSNCYEKLDGVTGFDTPGMYQVFFFAKDTYSENVSPMMETRVYKGKQLCTEEITENCNHPPEPFNLTLPEDGEITRTLRGIVAYWEEAVDPDGDQVTYTLEIMNNPADTDWETNTFYFKKEGISELLYSVGEEANFIDLRSYLWNVTAVDQYGAVTRSSGVWDENGISDSQGNYFSFDTDNSNDFNGRIWGFIRDDESGQSISHATYTWGTGLNHGGNLSKPELPTPGTYELTGQPDTYQVTFEADGYDTKIVNLVFNESVQQIDITLARTAVDTDTDGVLDAVDNCPENQNADQLDNDQDGVGDVCDDDHAPEISGHPGSLVLVDQDDPTFSIPITATDFDEADNLTFSIVNKPAWAILTDNLNRTATLSGTPGNSDVGTTVDIVITVHDNSANSNSDSLPPFDIEVNNTNDVPEITSLEITTATEDSEYTYAFTATDVDIGIDPQNPEELFLTAPTLPTSPAWLTFTDNGNGSGTLTGTPDDAAVDDHSIVLRVSDGELYEEQSFTITVDNVNDLPTISGSPATTVFEHGPYDFTPSYQDDDIGETVEFSITNKPLWASFSTVNGQLSGTPGDNHVGTTFGIVITVIDSKNATDSLGPFDLTVININDVPTISGIPVTSVNQDQAYSFIPTAGDADNDPLTFSIVNMPL